MKKMVHKKDHNCEPFVKKWFTDFLNLLGTNQVLILKRCQPRFACLDFADLTQSGWAAALGFSSLSLWIFGLPDMAK